MSKEIIYELARIVQESIGAIGYGRIRTKLNKNGFSEISLYSAVARHCEENEIKPCNFRGEMETLLRGCCENVFYPKTDDRYHYLRGQYFDLRHGNLEQGEAKSPEQRKQFLCNSCYLVKPEKDRCKNRNEKNSCQECKDKRTRQYYADRQKKLKKDKPEKIENSEAIVQETLSKISEKSAQVEEKNFNIDPNYSIESTQELIIEEPIIEETILMPETTQKPVKERSFAHLLGGQTLEAKVGTKLSEVIADEKGATITINCSTANLHMVLSALSHVTED